MIKPSSSVHPCGTGFLTLSLVLTRTHGGLDPHPRTLCHLPGAAEETSPEAIGKALEVVCEYLDEAHSSKLRAEYVQVLGAAVKAGQKRAREDAPKRDAWKMTEDADNNQALAMGFGKDSKVRLVFALSLSLPRSPSFLVCMVWKSDLCDAFALDVYPETKE